MRKLSKCGTSRTVDTLSGMGKPGLDSLIMSTRIKIDFHDYCKRPKIRKVRLRIHFVTKCQGDLVGPALLEPDCWF